MKLVAANAILQFASIQNRGHPFVQADRANFHDRADFGGELFLQT